MCASNNDEYDDGDDEYDDDDDDADYDDDDVYDDGADDDDDDEDDRRSGCEEEGGCEDCAGVCRENTKPTLDVGNKLTPRPLKFTPPVFYEAERLPHLRHPRPPCSVARGRAGSTPVDPRAQCDRIVTNISNGIVGDPLSR